MGRNRHKNVGIDVPYLMVRTLPSGKRLYYYQRHGKQTRLPDAFADAVAECKRLTAERPAEDTIASGLELWMASEEFAGLAKRTGQEYRRAVVRLSKVFGRMHYDDIEPHHVAKYHKLSTAKTRAKNDLAALSSFWSWAKAQGMHKLPNPREGLVFKTPKTDRPYITDAVYKAVYDAGCTVVQDAMDLLYLTGADVNVMLRWKDTDIDEEHCLPTMRTKTGKGNRKQLFVDGVETELKRVIDRCMARPVRGTSRRLVQTEDGKPVSSDMLDRRFTAARKKAGVWFELRQLRNKAASDAQSDEDAANLLNNDVRMVRAHYRKGGKVKPLR